ncbi:alpha-amylase family glycosyl hydrolase [Pantoea ananatis]|uniref:alpha-amylase family glycosyl hydrolase n=1 Tax=Pantoea ananas TaxID=553 RepID=UPI0039B93A61
MPNGGLGTVYLSPIGTAVPGSTHGYDVTDPRQVNPELGGEPALLHLSERARSHGMGLIAERLVAAEAAAEADAEGARNRDAAPAPAASLPKDPSCPCASSPAVRVSARACRIRWAPPGTAWG